MILKRIGIIIHVITNDYRLLTANPKKTLLVSPMQSSDNTQQIKESFKHSFIVVIPRQTVKSLNITITTAHSKS